MEKSGFWHRQVVAGIGAAAEATFPENDFGAPDWRSTEMVPRTIEYLDELPPAQGRLVSLLFGFVELAATVLVFGFRRFSKIPAARRTEIVRGWRRSRFQALRILGDAIKATTTMMYMSHPSVIAYIEEFRACRNSEDPLEIEHRPDALEVAVE